MFCYINSFEKRSVGESDVFRICGVGITSYFIFMIYFPYCMLKSFSFEWIIVFGHGYPYRLFIVMYGIVDASFLNIFHFFLFLLENIYCLLFTSPFSKLQ